MDGNIDGILGPLLDAKGQVVAVAKRVAHVVMPSHYERAALRKGIIDAINAKRLRSEDLNAEERAFFEKVVNHRGIDREVRILNAGAEANEVAPSVADQMKALGPGDAAAETPGTFWERWREDVSIVTDESVRHMFARVLAGEAIRPGTFSLTTLEVLRRMQVEDARLFTTIAPFLVFGGKGMPFHAGDSRSEDFYRPLGFSHADRIRLEEIGLLSPIPSSLIAGHLRGPDGQSCGGIPAGRLLIIVREPSLKFGALVLTRAGRELFSIVATESSTCIARLMGVLHPTSDVRWMLMSPSQQEALRAQMPGPVELKLMRPWTEA